MSSRSIGVMKVVFSRRTISWVIWSPACSTSLIAYALARASDGAGGLSQQPPGRGGEGVEPRLGHHDERAEVRVILGEAEPLHRPRRRQHEPVVEDQAAAVTHGDGALEEREPPRLAARDA